MKEARDIQKLTYNGRKVKLFRLWRKVDDAWIFDGYHIAPARTANRDLVAHAATAEDAALHSDLGVQLGGGQVR